MTPEAIQIIIIAIAVSLGSTLLNKKIVNQDRMEEIKAQISAFQKKLNAAKKKGDEKEIKKLEEEQKQMLGLTKEMFINSFKPLLYTFIPVIIIFVTLNSHYGGLGNIIELPLLNWELNWFWWYIIVSVLTAVIFELFYKRYRKAKKKEKDLSW